MKIKQKSIIWEKKLKNNCIIKKTNQKNNISITIKVFEERLILQIHQLDRAIFVVPSSTISLFGLNKISQNKGISKH